MKILQIEDIAGHVASLRSQGKRIVQCHGCFDLVHVGHVRHLRQAKQMGDVMIVTITPDRFVNKGPGRPLFNENLRLEHVASLQCVDYVCLNDAPDAVRIIEAIKPDYYVKGPDYLEAQRDVTGKIQLEKEAVERFGGKLVITSDVALSSTHLINNNFGSLLMDDETKRYTDFVRQTLGYDDLVDLIESFGDLKVLVVGDVILDEYCYCRVFGTITKSPSLSVLFEDAQKMLGGSLAVCKHIASYVERVDIIGVLGIESENTRFINAEMGKWSNIRPQFFNWRGQPTILKQRFISGSYPNPLQKQDSSVRSHVGTKLFEVNYLPKGEMDAGLQQEILECLDGYLDDCDAVVIADFGHGLVTPSLVEKVAGSGKWWAINSQTNSSNYGFNLITRYRGPSYVCIDELEARLPFGSRLAPLDQIAESLKDRLGCREILITRGPDGISFFGDQQMSVPAIKDVVIDTVGAGDAVLSISSLCRYRKAPIDQTLFLSVCAGALASKIVCNEFPVSKGMLLQYAGGILK